MKTEFDDEIRKSIGFEIHEGLGHDLLEIAIKTGILAEKLEKKSLPETADAKVIENNIINAIKKNRGLANIVYPSE